MEKYANVFLKSSIKKRIHIGHPWVYDNEVDKVIGEYENGDIVKIFYSNNFFCGYGFINNNSQIRLRIFERKEEEIINKFYFKSKIELALKYRLKLGFKNNFRVVFSEGDNLSGLVIDKYSDYIVLQTLSLGMDKIKDVLVEIIEEIFKPKGIYERNDVNVRTLEGLEKKVGFLSKEFNTEFIIEEFGIKFYIDVANGQKTGFYLDQSENRLAIKKFVKNADVLDAFTYQGAFGIYAAKYGAKSVLGIDESITALNIANKNAKLNGFDKIYTTENGDFFELAKDWNYKGKKWDVVILDPPPLTKNRNQIENTVFTYKKLNARAFKMVKNGGFLITSSCSGLVNKDNFQKALMMAATETYKKVKEVYSSYQSTDHPVIWGLESTAYLKFFILEVNEM